MCGISGRQNGTYYVDCLKALINQQGLGEGSKVVVSSCASVPEIVTNLPKVFGNHISYNWIPDRFPLGVTFNHSVQKMVDHFGPFDGYLYHDSGICIYGQWGFAHQLAAHHKAEGDNAITAAFPSNDDGHQWWKLDLKPGPNTLPIGKATNMHCQIFDESWRLAYGRILPDVFASDRSESVFTFMAAAINRKVQLLTHVTALHAHSMDGASSGFRGQLLYPNHPLQKSFDQVYQEGHKYGYSYEECDPSGRYKHDPSKFDEKGHAKDPNLLPFIKENLFLSEKFFDYSKINHTFVPGD